MPKHNYKIDYSTHKVLSYSQYSLYTQCNHRWYLDYVKKLKSFQPSVHLTFGTSFHEVLQEYIKTMYEDSAKKADQISIRELLTDRMYANYKEELSKNGNKHFMVIEQFYEFLEDGVVILEWLRRHRGEYFKVQDHELVGIEIPLQQVITEEIPNVLLIGSIDLIIRSKKTGKYYIYDIKTSTHGWNDKDKRDTSKVNQVLFYKRFYSKEFNVAEDDIEVQFFIVRRKLYENSDFPIKRVQEYIPTQGKRKVEDAYKSLKEFVLDAFTPQGQYQDKDYPKNLDGCKWCPYKERPDLCSKK